MRKVDSSQFTGNRRGRKSWNGLKRKRRERTQRAQRKTERRKR
jgi:hypothetical protein